MVDFQNFLNSSPTLKIRSFKAFFFDLTEELFQNGNSDSLQICKNKTVADMFVTFNRDL